MRLRGASRGSVSSSAYASPRDLRNVLLRSRDRIAFRARPRRRSLCIPISMLEQKINTNPIHKSVAF